MIQGLIFLIAFVTFAFGDGFSDGRRHFYGTEIHWTKWLNRGGVIGMIAILLYFQCERIYELALGAILCFKALFDIGWTYGAKRKERVYIGVTSWDDKLIRRTIGVKFIGFIYYALIFIGVLLIFDAFRVY